MVFELEMLHHICSWFRCTWPLVQGQKKQRDTAPCLCSLLSSLFLAWNSLWPLVIKPPKLLQSLMKCTDHLFLHTPFTRVTLPEFKGALAPNQALDGVEYLFLNQLVGPESLEAHGGMFIPVSGYFLSFYILFFRCRIELTAKTSTAQVILSSSSSVSCKRVLS